MDAGTYYTIMEGGDGYAPMWPLYVSLIMIVGICILPFAVKNKEKNDEDRIS